MAVAVLWRSRSFQSLILHHDRQMVYSRRLPLVSFLAHIISLNELEENQSISLYDHTKVSLLQKTGHIKLFFPQPTKSSGNIL